MKVAVPHWQDRISPVFDVAGHVLLVDMEGNREIGRQEETLPGNDPWSRAAALSQMRAEVLICGAVSWPLEAAIRSAGIRVITNICGPVETVLEAFRKGQLLENLFLMPGCCGRRRRRYGGRAGRGRPWR